MSHDRQVSIAACWLGADGSHVEEVWAGPNSDDAMAWLIERAGRRVPVVIDGMSPASSMVPELKAARVKVVVTAAGDMSKACGLWLDDVRVSRLTHGGQDDVDAALAAAKKRPIGTAGGWGWDRKEDTSNLAPLVSITLARYGASLTRRKAGTYSTAGGRTMRQRNPRSSSR